MAQRHAWFRALPYALTFLFIALALQLPSLLLAVIPLVAAASLAAWLAGPERAFVSALGATMAIETLIVLAMPVVNILNGASPLRALGAIGSAIPAVLVLGVPAAFVLSIYGALIAEMLAGKPRWGRSAA